MSISQTLSIALTVASLSCQAYVPPIPALLKEALSGRKTAGTFEVSLSHRVKVSTDSEPIVVTERIVRNKNQYLLFFRSPGVESVIPGSWNGKEYRLPENKLYPSDSRAFMRVLLSVSSDELLPTLLNEEFVRRDQIPQYKSDFKFEGDPNLWNMRENYLIQPNIAIRRTADSTAYAITGLIDGKNRRSIWIDRSLKGVARLEWTTESGTTSWNFSNFTSQPLGGYYPKTMSFETQALTLVETTLEYAKPINTDQLRETKKTFEQAVKGHPALPSSLDGALKVLLSFR